MGTSWLEPADSGMVATSKLRTLQSDAANHYYIGEYSLATIQKLQ